MFGFYRGIGGVMGASAPHLQHLELLYPSKCIHQSALLWLSMAHHSASERVGECKTKTPSIKKGFSVSLAESIRFELMQRLKALTD